MPTLDRWEWKHWSSYAYSFIASNSNRKLTYVPELSPLPFDAAFVFDLF